jgi:hypothetical protein
VDFKRVGREGGREEGKKGKDGGRTTKLSVIEMVFT